MKEIFLSLMLIFIACKENDTEADSILNFNFKVDNVQFNQNWSNLTESSSQIYMEATDSISQFGIIFNKNHNYSSPQCELNFDSVSYKTKPGSFKIQSDQNDGLFTGQFSGTLYSDDDSVKITEGEFIWQKN